MKKRYGLLYWLADLDIRFKIIGLAIGSAILITSVVTITTYSIKSRDLNNQMILEADATADELASKLITPMLSGNVYDVHQLLDAQMEETPALRYVVVVDSGGEVIHDTFSDGLPEGLLEANNVTVNMQDSFKILNTDEGRVWDIAEPVLHGRAGIIRVGLSDKQYRAQLNSAIGEQFLVTGMVTLLALTIATLLGSFISSQIKALAGAADAVARGKLGYQVKVHSRDDLGRLSGAFNMMSKNLAEMRNSLEHKEAARRELMVKVIKAQEEERCRVARELHDNLGQCLSSLGFGLQSANLALDADPTKVRGFLRSLYEENLRSQNALRATIYAMRPSVLDDLGLIPALRSYAEKRVATQGTAIEVNAEGEDMRLPPEIETAVFRITQEALNNVVKHAAAKHVIVTASLKDDSVDVEILDDGRGFDSEKTVTSEDGKSMGILGMHERAELLDGWVKITSKPGQGSRVRVHIPIDLNSYSTKVEG